MRSLLVEERFHDSPDVIGTKGGVIGMMRRPAHIGPVLRDFKAVDVENDGLAKASCDGSAERIENRPTFGSLDLMGVAGCIGGDGATEDGEAECDGVFDVHKTSVADQGSLATLGNARLRLRTVFCVTNLDHIPH